ncbi:MAG: hypothetical protein ACW967_10825, partial [Candidatus Hodarchaeales archaeon]
MNRFQLEVLTSDNNNISFILSLKPRLIHYFLFLTFLSLSFILFLLRFLFEPNITITGFILSIIAILTFIIAIYMLRSLTTEFFVRLDYSNLKLSITKKQIFFFSQQYGRSYTGMVFEVESKNPSFLGWSRYFLVKAQMFKLPQSDISANKLSLDWK